MKKLAFTLLELVFVIVVIGIIAAMVIPRLDRDSIFEAANQMVKHIKYTQHLAMTEDIYNDQTPLWFRQRWEIQFYVCGGYAIHSDRGMNLGNAANADSAVDPQTGKFIFTNNDCTQNLQTDYEKIDMSTQYDVANLNFAGCNNVQQISFDTLGRPYTANTINGLLKTACNIIVTDNSGNSEIIQIQPETGFACILNAGGSCI